MEGREAVAREWKSQGDFIYVDGLVAPSGTVGKSRIGKKKKLWKTIKDAKREQKQECSMQKSQTSQPQSHRSLAVGEDLEATAKGKLDECWADHSRDKPTALSPSA